MKNLSDVVLLEQTVSDSISVPYKDQIGQQDLETLGNSHLHDPIVESEVIP